MNLLVILSGGLDGLLARETFLTYIYIYIYIYTVLSAVIYIYNPSINFHVILLATLRHVV